MARRRRCAAMRPTTQMRSYRCRRHAPATRRGCPRARVPRGYGDTSRRDLRPRGARHATTTRRLRRVEGIVGRLPPGVDGHAWKKAGDTGAERDTEDGPVGAGVRHDGELLPPFCAQSFYLWEATVGVRLSPGGRRGHE